MQNIEVTDMHLVAALFAYEANYVGVDRADKRNQRFLFDEELGVSVIFTKRHGVIEEIEYPTYEQIKLAYDTVSLMYPPTYVEALRRVKGIIHT